MTRLCTHPEHEQYGLGWEPSPDYADVWPLDQLYGLRGIVRMSVEALRALTDYIIPGLLPPVSNQGNTPECVAYSTGGMKGYEDRIDQGQFFSWDYDLFFSQIGGGPGGAYTVNAFKRMLGFGYPVVGADLAALHKIAHYYSVPLTIADVQNAIVAFGPVVFGMTWYESMFSPSSSGILTVDKSSGVAGGHAILVVGFRTINGVLYFELQNSWGTGWGLSGRAYFPASQLGIVGEAYKAVDVIETITVPFIDGGADAKTATMVINMGAVSTTRLIAQNGVYVIPAPPPTYTTIRKGTLSWKGVSEAAHTTLLPDGRTVYLLDRNFTFR
jgi:Papain family cysteine protease